MWYIYENVLLSLYLFFLAEC